MLGATYGGLVHGARPHGKRAPAHPLSALGATPPFVIHARMRSRATSDVLIRLDPAVPRLWAAGGRDVLRLTKMRTGPACLQLTSAHRSVDVRTLQSVLEAILVPGADRTPCAARKREQTRPAALVA